MSAMPQLTLERARVYLNLLACLAIVTGLFFSRVALSVGMIVLVSNVVLTKHFLVSWKSYFRKPEYWLFGLFFLLVLISGLYSEHFDGFLERLKGKTAFLLLPLAFCIMNPLERKPLRAILLYVFLLSCGSAIWSLVMYFSDFEAITSAYHQAKVIPTPFHHVRFSVLVAFFAIFGLFMFTRKNFVWKFERWLWLSGGVLLSIYLHILAVRSGLAGYYMATISLTVLYIFQHKKYLQGGAALVLIALLPAAAYFTVPSFKKKLEYMKYDMEMYSKRYVNKKNYSDSRRFLSIEMAINSGMQSPIWGHGYGDIRNEMKKTYRQQFPNLAENNMVNPHNQFAFTFVGLGLMGLFVLLLALLFPLFSQGRWKYPAFLTFNVVLFSSFFTEHTLEDQFGTAIYLFFLLLLMKHPDL